MLCSPVGSTTPSIITLWSSGGGGGGGQSVAATLQREKERRRRTWENHYYGLSTLVPYALARPAICILVVMEGR